MDKKSLLVLTISFAVVMLWFPLWDHFFPPPAPPVSSPSVSLKAGSSNTASATQAPAPAAVPDEAGRPAASLTSHAVPESLLIVTNGLTRYTFTSYGGGIRLVELLHYQAAVSCGVQVAPGQEVFATLNSRATTPSMSLSGGEALGGEADFTLSREENGVRATRVFPNGLRLVKDFGFGTNYQLTVRIRLENSSAVPLRLPDQELVVGTSSLMDFKDSPLLMGFFWYNGSSAEHVTQSYFDNRTLGCIPGTPRALYLAGETNVVWAAVHNQFFALAVTPREPAPQIVARRVNLQWNPAEIPAGTPPAQVPPAVGLQTSFRYPPVAIAPGQAVERQYTVYAGPKEYNTLARLGAAQKNNLDLIMDFGFFGFASKTLLLSMNGLKALGLSYGLAIICITVIVKLLFWPLTHASTRSMKRMQAFQPQMKAIQAKYKDDPTKMNQKLMAFMKENKVSPLGGCLPMLLQIPVFMGFYRMLQSAIELRGASFLWACDLSQPDTVAHIGFLGNFPVNPLPLFMGATQLWQARLTPPAPGVDPSQQKMMRYMPLMVMVFLYKTSAGLTLYWAVQNLLTIVQMKVTKTNDPAAPAPVVPAAGLIRPRK